MKVEYCQWVGMPEGPRIFIAPSPVVTRMGIWDYTLVYTSLKGWSLSLIRKSAIDGINDPNIYIMPEPPIPNRETIRFVLSLNHGQWMQR